MSIAYGFDPNVSPIYDDENDLMHSVHFSSADTPRASGRVANRTMGVSRISTGLSGDFHEFHQQCAPGTSKTPDLTEDYVENSEDVLGGDEEEVVADSREVEEDEDEVVPESVGYLEGTFIVLSAGCCLPIRYHLSKKLKEMGAELQKTVDSRTTHIVVDRYADETLVGIAMSRTPQPPLMVDIKWIQECLDHRKKCEENDYSMTGLRYLRQTCRRLSSFREPTPFDDLEETFWEDMENPAPTDPAKLLEEIRKLSERMDALLNYVPVIRFEYHSPDCPTRQRPEPPRPRPNPTKLTLEAFQNLLTSISSKTTIRRRRSFTGFILEHRNPFDDVINVQKANKDVRETWEKPENQKKSDKKQEKRKKAPQKTVNDMKKTMATDLTVIRNTLGRNADINRARTPRKAPRPQKKPASRTKMEPVRADDSDIQSALASLTISGQSQRESIEIIEDTSKRRAPLVPTKSNVINNLQKRIEEDDDFISDVSAFILNRKNQSRRMRATEEEAEEMKNQVVFTGFNKDSAIEKKLKSIVRRFKLNFSTEIDESRTLCVISNHGKRTLVVLKAICCNVPIVKPQWLEESFEDSQLLPIDDYIYDEWLLVKNNRIFEHFHLKMWISPDCTPQSTELAWMIQKCGGKITRHLHKSDLVIAPNTFVMPEIHVGLESATPLFIIDSVSMAALQNYLDYVE
uniref:BRCT domain-containing protein n=1 Tax=Caenorhabditis tropicalis TaxID=1561998 RepID=A0A1I7TBS6_9PELO